MEKQIVKYNNDMNKIPLSSFTKMDLNFFYSICAKVKNQNDSLVRLSFEEIADLSAYTAKDHPERLRKDLCEMSEKLSKINFKFEDSEADVFGNLFDTFRVMKAEPKIEVKVNTDFLYFFNEVVSNFTQFELEEYVTLSGIYSKALYRYLKQWKTQGKTNYGRPISVDEMKFILGAENYSTKELNRIVIEPAVKELRKRKGFSNLWCEIKYAKKRGKPVDGYIFYFEKESLEGQISFNSIEQFDELAKEMSDKEKAATVAIANNIKKAKTKPAAAKAKKEIAFNNFHQREYDHEKIEELLLSTRPMTYQEAQEELRKATKQ